MPKTLEERLAEIGVPLNLLLSELKAIAARNPDMKGAADSVRALVLAKFSPEAIAGKAANDAAELVALFREGRGEIDRDNVTDIQ